MKRILSILVLVAAASCAYAQFTVAVTVSDVSCYGLSDGGASVSVTGGSGSYNYLWDDDATQTTPTATNLTAGEYNVHIEDGAGNDTTITVVVKQPDQLVIAANINPAQCGGANGRIIAEASGGTPGYAYTWSHTGINSVNGFLDNLLQGSYHLLVTDDHGCAADSTITVPEDACEVKGEPAFTPNGDGYNDTWDISNISFYPNMRLIVYNRWGQKVHEQEGRYEAWDGTHSGMQLPDASYYYVIYRDKDHEDAGVETGNVTVVK
jgi:gliding motility-associated-like protein